MPVSAEAEDAPVLRTRGTLGGEAPREIKDGECRWLQTYRDAWERSRLHLLDTNEPDFSITDWYVVLKVEEMVTKKRKNWFYGSISSPNL
jgi:hypothetical protein